MAAYKALTLCRFGGKDYRPGENVPVGAFPEKQAAELALMGLIEIKPEKKAAKKKAPADFTEVSKIVEPEPEAEPAPVEEPEAEVEEPEAEAKEAEETAKPRRRRRKAAKE